MCAPFLNVEHLLFGFAELRVCVPLGGTTSDPCASNDCFVGIMLLCFILEILDALEGAIRSLLQIFIKKSRQIVDVPPGKIASLRGDRLSSLVGCSRCFRIRWRTGHRDCIHRGTWDSGCSFALVFHELKYQMISFDLKYNKSNVCFPKCVPCTVTKQEGIGTEARSFCDTEALDTNK